MQPFLMMIAKPSDVRRLLATGRDFGGFLFVVDGDDDPTALGVEEWARLFERPAGFPQVLLLTDGGTDEFCLRVARGDAAGAARLRRVMREKVSSYDLSGL
ncbi:MULTISPECIES: hypothetical protein [Thermophilibacter]|uniref:hypothetical protein n=1 Tax=Thermophilibacter TaxID=2847307 RepID=UPI00235340E1|nr:MULTISPECIES: hypothetical protein [Thermophilibacter]